MGQTYQLFLRSNYLANFKDTPLQFFLNYIKLLQQKKKLLFEPLEAACGCFIFSLFDHNKSSLTYEFRRERKSSIYISLAQ